MPGLVFSAFLMGYSVLAIGMNFVNFSGMGNSDQQRAIGNMVFQVAVFVAGIFLARWCLHRFRKVS